jgi:hypothetical protein
MMLTLVLVLHIWLGLIERDIGRKRLRCSNDCLKPGSLLVVKEYFAVLHLSPNWTWLAR